MKKILVLLSLLMVLSCFDHLSESALDQTQYDATKDQDTDPDVRGAMHPNPDAMAYVRKDTWPSGASDDGTVYYLIADVFIDHQATGISDDRVKQYLTGHHVSSINNLLYQAGIVIGGINIYRVKKPADTWYYTYDFVFNKNGNLLDTEDADAVLNNSRGDHFRMAIHSNEDGGGIASISPASHAFAFHADSGRNLIAHEIGHIFRLWHSNILRAYPCDYAAKSYTRAMSATIHLTSWRFVDCEIAIMRQYVKQLFEGRARFRKWIKTGSNFDDADADYVVDPDFAILVENIGRKYIEYIPSNSMDTDDLVKIDHLRKRKLFLDRGGSIRAGSGGRTGGENINWRHYENCKN